MTRKPKKPKKPSFAASFSRVLSAYVPFLVFLAMLCNVFVVWRFEKERTPLVYYYVSTNTVVSSSSPSNSLHAAGVRSPSSSSKARQESPDAVPPDRVKTSAYYDYFLVARRRGAKIWDRCFYEGSLTSYGTIETIYPDRILLDDGSFIVNSRWVGGGRSFEPSLLVRPSPSMLVKNEKESEVVQ